MTDLHVNPPPTTSGDEESPDADVTAELAMARSHKPKRSRGKGSKSRPSGASARTTAAKPEPLWTDAPPSPAPDASPPGTEVAAPPGADAPPAPRTEAVVPDRVEVAVTPPVEVAVTPPPVEVAMTPPVEVAMAPAASTGTEILPTEFTRIANLRDPLDVSLDDTTVLDALRDELRTDRVRRFQTPSTPSVAAAVASAARRTDAKAEPPAEGTGRKPAAIQAVARGGLANLVGSAFTGLSGFVVAWLVARTFGKIEAGLFFASTAAFVLVQTVAKLGTQTSLVYWPARLRAFGNIRALRVCMRTSLVPVTVVGAVLGVGLYLSADTIASFAVHNNKPEYAHQLRLLAAFLPVAALSDAVLAATRGFRAMRPTVMLDRIVRPALQLGLMAALILTGEATPATFVLAWVGPWILTTVLAAKWLRGLLHRSEAVAADAEPVDSGAGSPEDRDDEGREPSYWLPRAFWKFTAPRAIASILQLALQRVDVILLAGISGTGAAALYTIAGRFVLLGQFVNQGVSQAVQPRLAESLSKRDRRSANMLYQTATAWLIVAAWPLYLAIAVFSGVYLRLFGHGYQDGGPVVIVLAMAMVVASGCGMVDIVLAMAGKTSWNLVNVGIALAVQLTIDVLLIPHLGPLGAAIGLGTAILLNNLVPLAQIGLVIGVHPFSRSTVTAAVLSVACFGVVPLVVAVTLGTSLPAGAVALLTGGGLYLAGLVRFRSTLHLDAFTQLRRSRRPANDDR